MTKQTKGLKYSNKKKLFLIKVVIMVASQANSIRSCHIQKDVPVIGPRINKFTSCMSNNPIFLYLNGHG